jgi:hypothetical protein
MPKPFGIRLRSYDLVFRLHIKEAETKARVSFERRKWMMFGYWKAVAIHLRKIYRDPGLFPAITMPGVALGLASSARQPNNPISVSTAPNQSMLRGE